MGWPTVATVISRAARELGLVSANISNPLTSTDPNILQLNALLQAVGDDMAREYAWTQLVRQGTLSITSGGSTAFTQPADFLRLIDESQWNTTTRMPVASGLTSQQWTELRAVPMSDVSWYKLRSYGGFFNILPAPTTTETIYYEYRSAYWVAETSGAAANTATIVAFDDELWFDLRLLVAAVKLYFRQAKGLDTTAEQQAFDRTLSATLGGDGDAPILSLSPSDVMHYIDASNAPDHGYGS